MGLRPVYYGLERLRVDTALEEAGSEAQRFDDAVIRGIFLKNKEWAYEDELRQIFKLDDPLITREPIVDEKTGKPIIDEKTGKEALSYFYPLPAEAVVSVSFGTNCPTELEEQVNRALQRNPNLAHVRRDRARPHESEFELVFE